MEKVTYIWKIKLSLTLYKVCLQYSGYAFVSCASCDMKISLEMVSNAHVHQLKDLKHLDYLQR